MTAVALALIFWVIPPLLMDRLGRWLRQDPYAPAAGMGAMFGGTAGLIVVAMVISQARPWLRPLADVPALGLAICLTPPLMAVAAWLGAGLGRLVMRRQVAGGFARLPQVSRF